MFERTGNWVISVAGPETAKYGRIIVDGAWSGDLNVARRLLVDVATELQSRHRLTCLSTCGAFLRFDWPQELEPKGNWKPNSKELAALTRDAEKAIKTLLTEDVVTALQGCCDYLTLGVDTKKEMISIEHNRIREPHVELVALVTLRNGNIHWTGKFYPTSAQQRTIVRFPDLSSHFVQLNGDRVMILGCHDLSVYSPRGRKTAGAKRRNLSKKFRELAFRHKPTVVLQHPHTTVKRGTWKQQWRQLRAEMNFVQHYLGTGTYTDKDRGWESRDSLEHVLESTQHGEILTVTAHLNVAREASLSTRTKTA
jgi:hypothetical protein